jgi:hypothetical protein
MGGTDFDFVTDVFATVFLFPEETDFLAFVDPRGGSRLSIFMTSATPDLGAF